MSLPAKSTEAARPTITVTLDAQYHAYILDAAREDERTPSKWVKRYLQDSLVEYVKNGFVVSTAK